MKRFLKGAALLTGCAVLALAGVASGYGLCGKLGSDSRPRQQVYAYPPEQNGARVGVNTVVRYVYSYTDDDGQLCFEQPAPSFLAGLDAEGVKRVLGDCEVCELTDDRLVVRKTIEGRSSAHYSIGEKDGYVAVYFENGILKEKTATPLDGLEPELKARVMRGIKIDGAQELVKCLEDIES